MRTGRVEVSASERAKRATLTTITNALRTAEVSNLFKEFAVAGDQKIAVEVKLPASAKKPARKRLEMK